MAQPQQNINIGRPGFLGVNTQDSPIELDANYAARAENCVIDQNGRVASRKGFSQLTSNPDVLGGNPAVKVTQFRSQTQGAFLFACGNNKIFRQQTDSPFELVEQALPGGYTITADDWQILSLGDKAYFVQANHTPLLFDANGTPDTLVAWANLPATGTYGNPNCAAVGFGRLWCADFDTNQSIVYWSKLLDGGDYSTDSGFINIAEYWPNRMDRIQAVHVHNNFLVIFGRSAILLYNIDQTGPQNSETQLVDDIDGIGCIARDTVTSIATDVLFVDATGVRALGRTIQEKSVDVGDLSRNVRDDFQNALVNIVDDNLIKAVWDPDESLYVVFLPGSDFSFVFDTRGTLENGAARATTWNNAVPRSGCHCDQRITWYSGMYGVYVYEGYNDQAKTSDAGAVEVTNIAMYYVTHPLTFGDPVRAKFPKQIDITSIGGTNISALMYWGFDYATTFTRSKAITITGSGVEAYFNESEFNTDAEYTEGTSLQRSKINTWGSGTNMSLAFYADVSGQKFSIQELNVQALLGRIL